MGAVITHRLRGSRQVRYSDVDKVVAQENDGEAMPVSQLVFFACWLAVALLGAAALLFVWQKWQAKSDPGN